MQTSNTFYAHIHKDAHSISFSTQLICQIKMCVYENKKYTIALLWIVSNLFGMESREMHTEFQCTKEYGLNI